MVQGPNRDDAGLPLLEPVRRSLQSAFSGQSTGVPPWLARLADGTDVGPFPPGSAAWAVHGGMPPIVAGIRALLVQALHPGALAGVHDHSRYREDPLGRLAGTIQWIFTVTYGDTKQGVDASNMVLKLHERVVGSYANPRGETVPYAANDPDLARWVHLAFTDSFLRAQQIWGDGIPGGADAYVAEWAYAGELMGVAHPPRTESALSEQLRSYLDSGALSGGERVNEVVAFLKRPPFPAAFRPAYAALFGGAVASIPPEYRSLLGLRSPRWPARQATGVVLAAIARILGPRTTAERYALERIDRLGPVMRSSAA